MHAFIKREKNKKDDRKKQIWLLKFKNKKKITTKKEQDRKGLVHTKMIKKSQEGEKDGRANLEYLKNG